MGLRPRCFQTRQLPLTARLRLPAAGRRRFLCQGPEPTGLPGAGSSAGFAPSLLRTSRACAGRAPARSGGKELTCFPEPPGQPYKEALAAQGARAGTPGLAAAVNPAEHPGNGPFASSPRGYQTRGRSSGATVSAHPGPQDPAARSASSWRGGAGEAPGGHPAPHHQTRRLRRRKPRRTGTPPLP